MELIKIGEKDDLILLRGSGGRGYFSFIDMLRHEGKEYALLADEADEYYVMEFIEGRGGEKERYREITDDALFETVSALFESRAED